MILSRGIQISRWKSSLIIFLWVIDSFNKKKYQCSGSHKSMWQVKKSNFQYMYELGIVSTFFYHRGHSSSEPVGLQYQFEWVPYLHRNSSMYKIVRNIKSHPSASLNEPRSTITMNLMSNSRTVLQSIFYDRLLQVKRLKKKPSFIRVIH